MWPSGTAGSEGVIDDGDTWVGVARIRAGSAAAAVVLLLTAAACASDPDSVGSSASRSAGLTSPSSPAPSTATPPSMPEGHGSGNGAHIPIEPGTYVLPRSAWSVADYTVTFPEGWTVQYGHAFAQHHDTDDELGFYAVVVDEIYADACQGERGDVVTVGPGVRDLVDALLAQPGPSKRGPVYTALGGFPAVRIDLSIPPRLQRQNCFMGPGTGVQIWHSRPADKYFVLLPGTLARVYVLDVAGRRQVFLTQLGDPRSTRDRTALQSVLSSIRIEPAE